MSSQIVVLPWQKSPRRPSSAVQLLALLLPAIAAIALALAGWRLAADLRWTNSFFIGTGFLSHWQVWCAIAISVQFLANRMNREAVRAAA
jgi:hypothetical protein